MVIVTGDRYLEKLVKFVDEQAGPLIEGTLVLKLNPAGLHYVQSRLEALHELESLLAGAPVDYLRAYVSDLGDHRALEQLRRILRLLTSLKVVSVLPLPARDPTPLSFLPFGRLKVLELRGCDLSTSAAKGLLELRHTLEKIICHNSTDALRHVFASRIAEIKDSSQWNRLSFVSCACNGLVLMDESLQLLPAVETLDLSRNKFAKIDNLRKCTKLKHLDLGFNHLRTIAPFNKVSCHIVKLVLRNNALTTLRGIENLKSLEGLDVSYNIISNFSELQLLASLPFLQSLWLEGNPLCCARWYRAQVFSFFAYPEKLKLDDKEINADDFWKRQIIIASKHKRPSSFGIYLPAKDEDIEEGSLNRRRKASRLAYIENEEDITSICSDRESMSCGNDIQNRDDPDLSDGEAKIVDLIDRVEKMKKERSILWLREFKEWMDIASGKFVDSSKECRSILHPQKENCIKNRPSQGQKIEVSRYASDSVLASGDESSLNIVESDSSFVDTSVGFHNQQNFDCRGLLGNASGALADSAEVVQDYPKSGLLKGISSAFSHSKSSRFDGCTIQEAHRIAKNGDLSPLSTIGDISGSFSSSACLPSPPHFQEGLFQRRQNLVEEIMQLSADSFSVASSDSNTSCSEVDYSDNEQSVPEIDNFLSKKYVNESVDEHISLNLPKDKFNDQSKGVIHVRENGINSFDLSADQTSKQCSNDFNAGDDNGESSYFVNQDAHHLMNRKSRKKAKKRFISILEESSNGNACNQDFDIVGKRQISANCKRKLDVDDASELSVSYCCNQDNNDLIVNYFNTNIADSEAHEICRHCVRCNCVLQREPTYKEREVAVLLSSHMKLYLLLITAATDESGTLLSLLSSHKAEEVCEVLVGMGLQVVRVNFEIGETYLFITRSIEKSRELLWTLQVSDLCGENDKCSIRSLEQVQVDLFDNQICGGSSVSIYQYAMVLVCCNDSKEESWLSRSLFVIGGYVLICIEDVMQLCSFSSDVSLSPYFRIDSCCSITDICEALLNLNVLQVIEVKERFLVTLVLVTSTQANVEVVNNGSTVSRSIRLKIQWFSRDNMLNFVSLLKAIHEEKMGSGLVVRCIS
ncbi:Serine/threonine-protein kinase 11-interacting protein [Senna tora]|uniref:Serine/threonine-protein kinase 11-interacting protein n=1 Tax=Senna tora TaxID=362788 RepID=A0A834THA4_9FABA|nr:Serine/threonine-protein kinase 11-interacting protein [Senna tora]